MTQLRFEDYCMPAASLGEESALPDIHVNAYIRAAITVSDKVCGEDARDIGHGMLSTLLPYRIQDGYGRERKMRSFRAAVLENEYLRAVFLPELGGRLWSLFDKRENRELLYRNDVFQPANLALRNAWFSGGVEWNVGIKGHNPLTASPLFAAKGQNKAGEPVLKMYEYERIRGVVYTLEAALVNASLLVNVTVENMADTDTYMYWWSNIAVSETDDCRVLAPAQETFFCSYTDGAYLLDKGPLPMLDGLDISYPKNSSRSRDFFYDIPKQEDKWVAAVDRKGRGLLHLSDPLLIGRKLFVWGNHTGGRHWNDWLSDTAGPYVEIQAGLKKTQLEHFVMPARSTLSWQECYTALTLPPETAHNEYAVAVNAISAIVREKKSVLNPAHTTPVLCDAPIIYGSGWGAVEEKLRKSPISTRCVFPDDSIGKTEREWVDLLEGRALTPHDPHSPILSYVVGNRWLSLLESYKTNDWYIEYHRGIARYAAGDIEGARTAFLSSHTTTANAWALRGLAMLLKNLDGNCAAAVSLLQEAFALLPSYRPLAVECMETMLTAGLAANAVALYESLSDALAADGRLRMLYGAALARTGNYSKAAEVVSADLVVPDIKEGEYALSHIFFEISAGLLATERGVTPDSLTAEEIAAAYPLPRALDFRMH